jgi:phosphatidylinositol alpha-1,6-mannosyltransferase
VRYLILTPDFPPAEGGVQRLLGVIAGGLAARHDVEVVAPAAPGAREWDVAAPFTVWRYPRAKSRAGRVWRLTWAAAFPASRRDVLFCGHVAAAPSAWLLGLLFRKPYFVYVHALEITPRRYRRLFSFLLRRARGIIVGSRYARDLVVSYFSVPAGAVDLVPPSVAPELLAAARGVRSSYIYKEPGERVLLSVGRLSGDERYKGHDVVIRALPLIRRCIPKCYYWIVGSGDDAARLEGVAAEMGVSAHVKFWGRVEDVAPFYRECDVFVLVNRRIVGGGMEKAEGFGLVFLEASLFAKPVIAGRCGGALDAVDDGRTGLLVDPHSPAEVAAAVVALLTCPVEAKRLGAAGRDRVLREFTPDVQVKRLEAAVRARVAKERG